MYHTTNLYEAAFLRTHGCRMLASRAATGRIVFNFADTDQVRTLATTFHCGGVVNAKLFANHVRGLKGVLAREAARPETDIAQGPEITR